jgi:alcohol dehydrogenase (cytochrome c)
MAYNPETQIAYVPAFGDHSMDLQAKVEKYTRGELYLGIKTMKFYGGGGELRAINAKNGELVWVHNNPMPFRSSVITTAGNLVFAGDTEGYIKAFNATTGAQLWSFNCGTAVMGGVNTFTVDGEQFLAVVAGQAGTAIETGLDQDWPKKHQKGGYLITFGLH